MGNIGPDITYDELRRQHADAIRIIHEQRQKIEKLERRCSRLRELYESSLAVVCRYQEEREALLYRVERALLGIEGATHVNRVEVEAIRAAGKGMVERVREKTNRCLLDALKNPDPLNSVFDIASEIAARRRENSDDE